MAENQETAVDRAQFSQGMGTLSKLPREIRDKIYRYLVKDHYRSKAHDWIFEPPDYPHSAVLRLSKAISHEAITLMYSESTFIYFINYSSGGVYPHQTLESVAQRLMKIDLHLFDLIEPCSLFDLIEPCSALFYDAAYQKNKENICEAIIAQFTGTKITRTSMHITLHSVKSLTSLIGMLKTPFCPALGEFKGFRTLEVELCCRLTDDEISDAERTGYEVTRTMEAFKERLSPALGPATYRSNGVSGGFHCIGQLTFHPHQFNTLSRP